MVKKNTYIKTFLLVTFCVVSMMNAQDSAKIPQNSIIEINPDSKIFNNTIQFDQYILNQQYTHEFTPFIPGLPTSPLPISSRDADIPAINSSFSISDRDVEFDKRAAAHLLRRITFGPTWEEINTSENIGLDATVSAILSDLDLPEPPGDWINDPFPPIYEDYTPEQIDSLFNAYGMQFRQMRSWLLELMVAPETNIRESMTLFWHDHFATSGAKIFYPPAMYHQYNLIREYSLGNIKQFVKEMALNPAMLIWLDNNQNVVNEINENFAREVLELFTIGVGNYSQEDIVEAARAYTGYVTNGLNTFFIAERHDFGLKTFMGQTGYFFGNDIIDIIFEQEETARFFAKKILQWFVYYNPNEESIDILADILRNNDYEIKPMLEAIFSSELFYDENFRGAKHKGAITQIMSPIRQMYITDITPPEPELPDNILLLYFQEILGQAILFPPDVSGWSGYRNWINTYTLPYRKIFTNGVIDGHIFGYDLGFQANVLEFAFHFSNPNNADALIDDMILYFYDIQPTELTRQLLIDELLDGLAPYEWNLFIPDADQRLRGVLKLLMRYPEYQLK